MKSGKKLTVFALALCLIFALSGCNKETILEDYNDLLHYFSQYALTDEKNLQGEKTEGKDTYTGSYTAEYNDFSGTEYLFGGTGLERENGNELTVTYKLTVDSGSAKLYWFEGETDHLISDDSQSGTCSITLSSQDNYVALEGEKLKGALQISVE